MSCFLISQLKRCEAEQESDCFVFLPECFARVVVVAS